MYRSALAAAAIAAALLSPTPAAGKASLIQRADSLRATVWHMQDVMGVPRSPTRYTERRTTSTRYREWVVRLWQDRAREVRRAFLHPPRETAWQCIHRYEGSWSDSGSPYYGGLQMDLAFQSRYGPRLLAMKGTADRWTPLEQMWVAERAYRSGRGFYPWPNTARFCGLI